MKVSVVIPTYNRFDYLLNAIESVKNQTYDDIEIIVVNDRSSEDSYYKYDFAGVNILHLQQNTKQVFGYACAGFTRNKGIDIVTGTYIAFLDDDDVWLPRKIELQIEAIRSSGCEMSCSDGYIGNGIYDANKEYPRYNAEHYRGALGKIYRRKRKSHLIADGLPDVWNSELIDTHNCIIASSVIASKKILSQIDGFSNLKNGQEDWDCWRRALRHTNCTYVKEPCFYYDSGHGGGQKY